MWNPLFSFKEGAIPPHPYTSLFTLMEHLVAPNQEGGSHAIHEL